VTQKTFKDECSRAQPYNFFKGYMPEIREDEIQLIT